MLFRSEPGDVIETFIPYEENTPDYYNGHHPLDIRGEALRAGRFRTTGKIRPVVYIGATEDNQLLYLPITSSNRNYHDRFHQFRTRHKHTLQPHNRYRNSYVEISSLRAVPVPHDGIITKSGHLSSSDYNSVMHRLSQVALQANTTKDSRGYILRNSS